MSEGASLLLRLRMTTLGSYRSGFHSVKIIASRLQMKLHIRNPRARELARRLADMRKISMTKAVVEALESELRREQLPLAKRLAIIADDLRAKTGAGGRTIEKDEISEMWGEP